jgi:hypothetical protein
VVEYDDDFERSYSRGIDKNSSYNIENISTWDYKRKGYNSKTCSC